MVYNLGADAECTKLTVVREILRALGKLEDRIEHVKHRKGHGRRYAIEFSRAEEEFWGSAPR